MQLICDYSKEPIELGDKVILQENYLHEIVLVKDKYYKEWLKG